MFLRSLHKSIFFLMIMSISCQSTNPPTDENIDSGVLDAGDTDAGIIVDTDAGTLPADPWAIIDQTMLDALATNNVTGMGLAVYNANDQLVFGKSYGDFSLDTRVAIASASKMISGLVLLQLVQDDVLSLEDTTGDVLGWSGPQASITLRHLLSFTSGLVREPLCTRNSNTTLSACVDRISTQDLVTEPAAQFDYGSSHLHVAARMAEVRLQSTWNVIFREHLADALSLPAEVQYYTAPRQSIGTINPLVAGGLRTSMNEYALLLQQVFHNDLIFTQMAQEPFPDVSVGHSPAADLGFAFHYGLTSWLECNNPADGCTVISSPGAFGFTPWMDRENGYYAILGMELDRDENEEIVGFSMTLEQTLQPMILEALSQQVD